MLSSSVIDRQISRKQAKGSSRSWLFHALDGKPLEFNYSGRCFDYYPKMGACACGHEIRYGFELIGRGKSVIVGSSCVETYGECGGDVTAMNADLDRMKAEKAKAKKLEKQNRENALVVAAEKECRELWEELRRADYIFPALGLRIPDRAYWLMRKGFLPAKKTYASAMRQKAAWNEFSQAIRMALADCAAIEAGKNVSPQIDLLPRIEAAQCRRYNNFLNDMARNINRGMELSPRQLEVTLSILEKAKV